MSTFTVIVSVHLENIQGGIVTCVHVLELYLCIHNIGEDSEIYEYMYCSCICT